MAWLGQELNKVKEELGRLKATEPKPSQYPVPQLRLKVVSMVSELQGFLGEHGDEPVVNRLQVGPGLGTKRIFSADFARLSSRGEQNS